MVDSLTAEGVFADGLVASVEFGYDDDEDDGDDVDDLRPSTVWVLQGRNRHSPTRGRGMDERSYFPYSLAETSATGSGSSTRPSPVTGSLLESLKPSTGRTANSASGDSNWAAELANVLTVRRVGQEGGNAAPQEGNNPMPTESRPPSSSAPSNPTPITDSPMGTGSCSAPADACTHGRLARHMDGAGLPARGTGKPARARIRPSDPARLFAAALLGYAA